MTYESYKYYIYSPEINFSSLPFDFETLVSEVPMTL